MPSRPQLNWNVPADLWKVHEQAVLAEHGFKDLYAGVEAEQIVRLWFRFEESGASPRPGHTGDPLHTQKTNGSSVPLENQEKIGVHVRFHPGLKERLTAAANQYDVYSGVLLAYILREYYETDGWGYSIEAVGSDASEDRTPTTRAEKLDRICELLDDGTEDDLRASKVRETIADVAGPTVVDGANGYLSDVLDRLGYVHHPDTETLYMSAERREDIFDVTESDPAYQRKPWDALDKRERIKGIKDHLSRTGRGLSVSEIHTEIFDANGSKSYMRNLADEVAGSERFRFRTTPGGKKVLRSLDPDGADELEQQETPTDAESESGPDRDETDRESRSREEIEADAADEMDALMQGTPQSDGGVATTDGGTDVW